MQDETLQRVIALEKERDTRAAQKRRWYTVSRKGDYLVRAHGELLAEGKWVITVKLWITNHDAQRLFAGGHAWVMHTFMEDVPAVKGVDVLIRLLLQSSGEVAKGVIAKRLDAVKEAVERWEEHVQGNSLCFWK